MELGVGSNLRDEKTFPPFGDILNENDVSEEYYKTDDGFGYVPHRHWCFMGEIKDFNMAFVRLRITVRDTEGEEALVNFNTDDRGASLMSSCKVGYTLVILYPQQRYFTFGGSGFRIESMRSVKVLPYSLDTLLAANDIIFSKDRSKKCSTCGKSATAGNALSHCARCQVMYYCGRECQETSWKGGHKSQCRVFKALSWFTEKNWETFDGWFTF